MVSLATPTVADNGSLVWLVRKNKPNYSIQNRPIQVQTKQ